jgi:putative Mg2+ transporter-C (MgtC) family protein
MEIGYGLGVLGRLFLSVVLGGLVGWQRETVDRPAGFRTHVLVCVGSATYMLISHIVAGPRASADPGRIASQVASGMGFLGAGTILRHGNVVRGLTTAASLWAVAAIGLCAGMGGPEALAVAVLATVVVLATLSVLSRVERALPGTNRLTLVLGVRDFHATLPLVQAALAGIRVRPIKIRRGEETEGVQVMEISARAPKALDPGDIAGPLLRVEGVESVETP